MDVKPINHNNGQHGKIVYKSQGQPDISKGTTLDLRPAQEEKTTPGAGNYRGLRGHKP